MSALIRVRYKLHRAGAALPDAVGDVVYLFLRLPLASSSGYFQNARVNSRALYALRRLPRNLSLSHKMRDGSRGLLLRRLFGEPRD